MWNIAELNCKIYLLLNQKIEGEYEEKGYNVTLRL